MSGAKSIARRSELVRHQSEMNRLRDKHKAEVSKVETGHQIRKAHLRENQSTDIATIDSKHRLDLVMKNEENKKVLEKLDTSLQKVQNRIQKEQTDLKQDHTQKQLNQKKLHETEYTSARQKQSMMLQDMNEEFQGNLTRMQREFSVKKQAMEELTRNKLQTQKESAIQKETLTKDSYHHAQAREQNKFANAIHEQKLKHSKQMISTDQKNKQKVELKSKIYNEVLNELDTDGRNKIAQNQKRFEQDFNRLYDKQEITLTNLVGKKETLINSLKQDLTKEYEIGLEKSKDPFYEFGKLKVSVDRDQENNYEVKIPIPKHEAKKVRLFAYDRELKIEMERRFELDKKSEQGNKNSIRKVESYLTKIPVQDILDSKSVTRSYNDGLLIFKIKKA